MKLKTLSNTESSPNSEGVFCFYDDEKLLLYVGISEDTSKANAEIQIKKLFNITQVNSANIELIKSKNNDLIKIFAETIRRKKPLYNISLAEYSLYPHLRITREKFPRLLVTRKIESDKAEYFGAFLSETGVRFFLDFLNRTFRLRSCAIPIDGSFLSPCTQYYEKKCVAPCVASICEIAVYENFANFTRLFLRNKREELQSLLLEKIETAAGILDFETASYWRDILLSAQNVWKNKDLQMWLDDAVDSFEVEKKDGKAFVYLVTQRKRKVLGRRTFVFESHQNLTAETILSQVLWQFYQFHAPAEIRVGTDFHQRKFLAETLSRRENRIIKIDVIKPDNKKKITARAFGRSKFEFDLKQIKPTADYKNLQAELKKQFGLKYLPKRIECFDVAHISGTDFVAAKAVWENGEFLVDENKYWFFGEDSELKMLEKAVKVSYEENYRLPDLVMIDGGRSQLNAAIMGLSSMNKRKFSVISAVKPPNLHNQVSHFLSENGDSILMKADSEALKILVRLRDEAHDLANRIHRNQRDFSHFYELAGILPFLDERERNTLLQKFGSIGKIRQASQESFIELFEIEKAKKIFSTLNSGRDESDAKTKSIIIPIRFDDPNGDAKDLQPLRTKYFK